MKNKEDLHCVNPYSRIDKIDDIIPHIREYFSKYPNGYYKLYIHYPFCISKCKYCVFGSIPKSSFFGDINEYNKRLVDQIFTMNHSVFYEFPYIESLYFGGGTPSLIDYKTMESIINSLTIIDDIKIRKIEVHPSNLSKEYIDFLIDICKMNCISFGIQSFDDNILQQYKRLHINYDKIFEMIDYIRSKGINSSIDLVAGLDNKRCLDLKKSLDLFANNVSPDTIEIYPNYRSKDFYYISYEIRKVLRNFLDGNSSFYTNDNELTLDMRDTILHGDMGYVLNYKYTKSKYFLVPIDSDEKVNVCRKTNVIGLGGIDLAPSSSILFHDDLYFDSIYDYVNNQFLYGIKNRSFIENNISKKDEISSIDPDTLQINVGDATIQIPNELKEYFK